MIRFVAALLIVSASLFQTAESWTPENAKPECFGPRSGSLLIEPCAGWVQGSRSADNVTITFEVRAHEAGGHGALAISGVAIPLLGELERAPMSQGGEQLSVVRVDPAAVSRALRAGTDWQRYVVKRTAAGLAVDLNGAEIAFTNLPKQPDAPLAFLGQGSGIEVRYFQTTATGPSTSSASSARLGNGVTVPRLVHQAKPTYTPEARKARIQGVVVVECVVNTDGSVGSAKVIKSLDKQFGLDEEALKAARQYRFDPGTRNGTPVPVTVSIEITFWLGMP